MCFFVQGSCGRGESSNDPKKRGSQVTIQVVVVILNEGFPIIERRAPVLRNLKLPFKDDPGIIYAARNREWL